MNLAAALIYWVIIAIWSIVLITVAIFYTRNQGSFGTTRLLLAVIAIDTARNIVEAAYFGLFFGSHYGLFPAAVGNVLGIPALLILPKLANVGSGLLVLGVLLGRWLPTAMQERRTSETTAQHLRHLATVDGMTGLFNRSHFNDLAELEWERHRRYERPLSLVIVDIDWFKSINDRFGHDIGDLVIRQVALACQAQKRKSDIVGRLGGEEFGILLPETGLEEAGVFAERLKDVIATHAFANTISKFTVTVSSGVSDARGGKGLLDLLKQADLALYQAKRGGRNQVCLFRLPDSDQALAG